MIRIVFETDEAEKSIVILCDGHAGSAPVGRDLVCAAVSLVISVVSEQVRAMAEGTDVTVTDHELVPGHAKIGARCGTQDSYTRVMTATEWVLIAGRMLSASYPEYVTFNEYHA